MGYCSTGDSPVAYHDGIRCHCTESLIVNPGADNEHIITCDIDVGTPTTASDGELYGVTEYSDHDYSFFGIDEEGDKWCCTVDHEPLYVQFSIVALGSSESDTMSWDEYGGLSDTMAFSRGYSAVVAELHGLADEDTLQGASSSVSGAWGNQHFYGGSQDDTIVMGGGKCKAWGGIGADDIDGATCSGPEIWGDLGTGGFAGGDDTINATNDVLVYGEAGDDLICGSSGVDELHGGVGADTLWGNGVPGTIPDRNFGDGGTDSCGGPFSTFGNDTCESTRTVKPAGCN